MSNSHNARFLITGATGTVGRALVKLLLDDGQPLAAVTRNPATAALPGGVQVVSGDPSHPGTVASALHGVGALFLVPRATGESTAELLSTAAVHGVKRVVVLSAATVQYPAGYRRFADEFRAVEDAARASGLAWTILRCADFDANSLVWAPQIRSTGVVRGAYGEAATSPIHERDIAAVGARALLNVELVGHTHVLTGPQSLTQPEKVRLIGEVIGRQLFWMEISPEQQREGMRAQGLPADVPERLLGSLADYARRPGPTSADVEQLLGRPALSFAEWAADHAAAFKD
jgi:uncharacterized protein YbjT (DUF2867 family)